MKVPRDVDGRDFANHLMRRWNFQEVRQTGSHLILKSENPAFHISIPAHKPLKLGIFAALLSFVAEKKNVSVEQLLQKL